MAGTVGRPKTSGTTAKDIARRIFHHENTVLALVLIALTGILSFTTGGLLTTKRNLVNILFQSSVRGVASMGQAFVILSGGIDLSVAGIGLLSAILGGTMMTSITKLNIVGYPVPLYVALPVMIIAAAAVGAANGSLVAQIGMPSLIVTLGMWQILKGVSFMISGGYQVCELPEALAFYGQGAVAGVPVPVIVLIAIFAIAYFILYYTSFGRSIYAVGGNLVSSWLSGINVKMIQTMAFTISGLLAGVAGVIITARCMSAQMITLEGLELDSIASVVIGGVSLIGGRGNIIGVLIGVMIIGVINNGMSIMGAPPSLQGVAKGAIIIAAVAIDYLRRR
jgi:ribose/xylose/arabinose/galactoside ABC-type transport system permease subunit